MANDAPAMSADEFADEKNIAARLPPQCVYINPRSFAVLGLQGRFRTSSPPFNPTTTQAPFFQIFDPSFIAILGPTPSIRLISRDPRNVAFAHEAPIFVRATDEVFFASNDQTATRNNRVLKISLRDVGRGGGGGEGMVQPVQVPLPEAIQVTNGGTPFRGDLLFVNSGRGTIPPCVARVKHTQPYDTTVLLDNFFGRQFNSLNDVKIHPGSKKIFFTDVDYGNVNGFRPAPKLPNQVYRFDPDTGTVRVVADGFVRCNGIAFAADGKTAFVTDTAMADGSQDGNQTLPATIYAFDVDEKTQAFKDRRVFAYADAGIPDGIQLDNKGNVYAGAGDGVHVWNPDGLLIGKFFIGSTSAQMIFAGKGRLVILSETEIYLAHIAAEGLDLDRIGDL